MWACVWGRAPCAVWGPCCSKPETARSRTELPRCCDSTVWRWGRFPAGARATTPGCHVCAVNRYWVGRAIEVCYDWEWKAATMASFISVCWSITHALGRPGIHWLAKNPNTSPALQDFSRVQFSQWKSIGAQVGTSHLPLLHLVVGCQKKVRPEKIVEYNIL